MIFAILGPNGAGKTTLMRMLATLTRPDAGSAQVMGRDLAASPDDVRGAIAMTGQFASLDEDPTGRENLIMLARLGASAGARRGSGRTSSSRRSTSSTRGTGRSRTTRAACGGGWTSRRRETDELDRLRQVLSVLRGIIDAQPASDEALAVLRRESLPWFDIKEADRRVRELSAQRLSARLQAIESMRSETGRSVGTGATSRKSPDIAPPAESTIQAPQAPRQDPADTAGLPADRNGAAGAMAPAGDAAPAAEASLAAGTPASEAAVLSDKQGIRDLQARLLVMGFDPNGVDGIVGPGTRSAVRSWQATRGIAANGYLSPEQMSDLKAQSQVSPENWLNDAANARLHSPPPPIALRPAVVSGTWRFTTSCGPSSALGRMRITGVLSVTHQSGSRYTGRARQSQGFNGRFSGRIDGRRLTGSINWGLLVGRIDFQGTIADRELVIRGRDSNRCSFYAAKST